MKLLDKNRPFTYLRIIPITLILDVVIFVLALILDATLITKAPSAQGHPAPVFTILGVSAITIITAIGIAISIIMVIIGIIRNKK